jgi:hypothetical protein
VPFAQRAEQIDQLRRQLAALRICAAHQLHVRRELPAGHQDRVLRSARRFVERSIEVASIDE